MLRPHFHDRAVRGIGRAAQTGPGITAERKIAFRFKGKAAAGAVVIGGQVIGHGLVDFFRRFPQALRLRQRARHEQVSQGDRQQHDQHRPDREPCPLARQRQQIGRHTGAGTDERGRRGISDQLRPEKDAEQRHRKQSQRRQVDQNRHRAEHRQQDGDQEAEDFTVRRQGSTHQIRIDPQNPQRLRRSGQGADVRAAQRQDNKPRRKHNAADLRRHRFQQAEYQRGEDRRCPQDDPADLVEQRRRQEQSQPEARQRREQRVAQAILQPFRKRA